MALTKLNVQELREELARMPGWTLENNKLHREFRFSDFARAIGFMATAAIYIEKRDHHPEWSNVYNRVTVLLSTHDVGGITRLDLDLARLLDQVAETPALS